MYPAYSIIIFTCCSGAGYALLALTSFSALSHMLPVERWFGLTVFLTALVAITSGLMASTFHLGRPERAWRAFSQWKSSWLAREGVLAVVTYAITFTFAFSWLFLERIWIIPAVLLIICTLATISATAMIYATLKTVPRWNNIWTLPNYLGMALTSGSLWLYLICYLFAIEPMTLATVFIIIVSASIKFCYWNYIDRDISVATPGSATGLNRYGKVRPLTAPHTEENYLLKEMGFKVARKHAQKLRGLVWIFAFILPLIMLLITLLIPYLVFGLLFIAALMNALGTLVERWLFFAEARHVVMLYYEAQSA